MWSGFATKDAFGVKRRRAVVPRGEFQQSHHQMRAARGGSLRAIATKFRVWQSFRQLTPIE